MAGINYEAFLESLDSHLQDYFKFFGDNIHCQKGCSSCCENGDYPVSDIELEYLMKGYLTLDNSTKSVVQNNIKNMQKGGACPFLVNKECSVYKYRPIICRVHGLAYICHDNVVKLPHCVSEGKNFHNLYEENYFKGTPIRVNLDTHSLLKGYYNEIKNLYDWISKD